MDRIPKSTMKVQPLANEPYNDLEKHLGREDYFRYSQANNQAHDFSQYVDRD